MSNTVIRFYKYVYLKMYLFFVSIGEKSIPEWYASNFCVVLVTFNSLFISALIDLMVGPLWWIYIISVVVNFITVPLNYIFLIKDFKYKKIQEEYESILRESRFIKVLIYLYIFGSFISFFIAGSYARDMHVKKPFNEKEQQQKKERAYQDSVGYEKKLREEYEREFYRFRKNR